MYSTKPFKGPGSLLKLCRDQQLNKVKESSKMPSSSAHAHVYARARAQAQAHAPARCSERFTKIPAVIVYQICPHRNSLRHERNLTSNRLPGRSSIRPRRMCIPSSRSATKMYPNREGKNQE